MNTWRSKLFAALLALVAFTVITAPALSAATPAGHHHKHHKVKKHHHRA